MLEFYFNCQPHSIFMVWLFTTTVVQTVTLTFSFSLSLFLSLFLFSLSTANVSVLIGPPSDGSLYTAQALWEETAESIAVGTLHFSSLLKDESKSQLNSLLVERITSGVWNVSKINMVEINNVCDGGVALKQVLDALP